LLDVESGRNLKRKFREAAGDAELKFAYLLIATSAPLSTWVPYHISPIGNTHYYDLSAVSISSDGMIGRVRGAIIYGKEARENIKSLFGDRATDAASSTGYLVFQCRERTYFYEIVQEFDEIGQPIPKNQIQIELAPQRSSVTMDIEPAYSAVCHGN